MITDVGAGDGRFRSPSLRNVSLRSKRLNLTPGERDAIVAYLMTLTDDVFISAPKFSSPFAP